MEKNRAAFNLRRRNARKGITASSSRVEERHGLGREDSGSTPETQTPSQPFKTKKVGEFSMLVLPEEEKPATDDSRTVKDVVGGIYRNDHGGVISKFAWEKLQRLKEKAEKGGYQIDDYSQ